MSQHQQSSTWKNNSTKPSEVKKSISSCSAIQPPRGGGRFRLAASPRPRSNSITCGTAGAKGRVTFAVSTPTAATATASSAATAHTPAGFESRCKSALEAERKSLTKTSLLQQSRQKTNAADFELPDEQQHICQLHNDVLVQCLEKNGVYVCKSYGPRCFIIQKVSHSTTY